MERKRERADEEAVRVSQSAKEPEHDQDSDPPRTAVPPYPSEEETWERDEGC